MTLNIETILSNSRSYYEKPGSSLVGLTTVEAATARKEEIDLGHVSYAGENDHNEFVVNSALDRKKLKELFS